MALSVVWTLAGSSVAAPDTPTRPTTGEPTAASARYVDPAPVRVYRFHVYSTMKQRKHKRVTIESLVTTSASAVVEGDRALLERRVEAAPGGAAETFEWVAVAAVTVKKLLPRGRIEVEIESEEPEATVKRKGRLPFVAGQKVRLQVDRVLPPS